MQEIDSVNDHVERQVITGTTETSGGFLSFRDKKEGEENAL
jgi:hypothetical protein